MSRLAVCSLVALSCLVAAGRSGATLTVVVDYTFDDASDLAPFTQAGTPSVVGGQLVLDGNSYLEIADPLGGATDNYVVEAIVTASTFDAFDFIFARSDPGGPNAGNNGQGLLLQDFGAGPGQIGGLNSFSGATHSFTAGPFSEQLALDKPIALALVQNGGVIEVYINAVQVNETTSAPIIGTPTVLAIGTHPFDGVFGAFNGSIDRVRISTFNEGEFSTGASLLIPEPSSLALLGLGGLVVARRRRG